MIIEFLHFVLLIRIQQLRCCSLVVNSFSLPQTEGLTNKCLLLPLCLDSLEKHRPLGSAARLARCPQCTAAPHSFSLLETPKTLIATFPSSQHQQNSRPNQNHQQKMLKKSLTSQMRLLKSVCTRELRVLLQGHEMTTRKRFSSGKTRD